MGIRAIHVWVLQLFTCTKPANFYYYPSIKGWGMCQKTFDCLLYISVVREYVNENNEISLNLTTLNGLIFAYQNHEYIDEPPTD